MAETAKINPRSWHSIVLALTSLLVLVLIIPVLSGCMNSNASGSTVTGRALRFPLGNGVPFIRSLVHGDEAARFQVTDSNGSFTMLHVPVGSYQVKYARFGFLIYQAPLVITENMQTYVVDLPKIPLGDNILHGVVEDGEGELGDVEIWLVYNSGGIAYTTTNGLGVYSFEGLPDGLAKVIAISADHLVRMVEDVQLGTGGIDELDFELEVIPDFVEAKVIGTVTTQDGETLDDSYIGIFHNAAEPSLYMVAVDETLSTPDGYSLGRIPAGTYTVICTHSGFALKKQTIIVEAGQEYTVDFVLDSEEFLWASNQQGY